ncbi:hypothetical protein K435DRAFT_555315, partial [Dendrothele bispora CBS 962.96]
HQRLLKRHTGVYLAEQFFCVLKEFGIQDKVILAIAGDNAENNTAMIKHLQWLFPQFKGLEAQVRCF